MSKSNVLQADKDVTISASQSKKACRAFNATVIGNVEKQWESVGEALAKNLHHYEAFSYDSSVVGHLWNGLNSPTGNKSMAKAIKDISEKYFGIALKTSAKKEEGYTTKNIESDEAKGIVGAKDKSVADKQAVIKLLEQGGFRDMYDRFLTEQKENETDSPVTDSGVGFKFSKGEKADPNVLATIDFAHSLTRIKELSEQGISDIRLQGIVAEMRSLIAKANKLEVDLLEQAASKDVAELTGTNS